MKFNFFAALHNVTKRSIMKTLILMFINNTLHILHSAQFFALRRSILNKKYYIKSAH